MRAAMSANASRDARPTIGAEKYAHQFRANAALCMQVADTEIPRRSHRRLILCNINNIFYEDVRASLSSGTFLANPGSRPVFHLALEQPMKRRDFLKSVSALAAGAQRVRAGGLLARQGAVRARRRC